MADLVARYFDLDCWGTHASHATSQHQPVKRTLKPPAEVRSGALFRAPADFFEHVRAAGEGGQQLVVVAAPGHEYDEHSGSVDGFEGFFWGSFLHDPFGTSNVGAVRYAVRYRGFRGIPGDFLRVATL